MENEIGIYCENRSSRSEYILTLLMRDCLGCKIVWLSNKEDAKNYSGVKINYSMNKEVQGLQIIPHLLLFEYGIKDHPIEVQNHTKFQKIFFRVEGGDLPFDPFAAAFWLLSRYEEYLPHKADPYGRFHYRSSLAYQYDFLDSPLVNHWMWELSLLLKDRYPSFAIKAPLYRFLSTIDVDNAYLYRNKGFVRTIAGYVSSVFRRDLWSLKERTSILLGRKKDPFDCYDFLMKVNSEYGAESLYFFLVGDYGVNDKNIASTNLAFQELIKHVADHAQVGIHPSFGSNNQLQQLKVEVARLSNITYRNVSQSRQHYSMLHFPSTYLSLLQAGITDDHSMGYTNINGFRASYTHPYKWYSFEDESPSSLTIHPFCFTENTAEYNRRSGKASLLEQAALLRGKVEKYGGTFTTIFHNDTMTEEMRAKYVELVKASTRSAA